MRVQDWIDEWVNLYPKDVKWKGMFLRSPAKYCIKKMEKLCKENPHYTKDIIFEATKQYVKDKSEENWAFMKQATYFIHKLGEPSLLEQYCEAVINQKSKETNKKIEGELPELDDNPMNLFI